MHYQVVLSLTSTVPGSCLQIPKVESMALGVLPAPPIDAEVLTAHPASIDPAEARRFVRHFRWHNYSAQLSRILLTYYHGPEGLAGWCASCGFHSAFASYFFEWDGNGALQETWPQIKRLQLLILNGDIKMHAVKAWVSLTEEISKSNIDGAYTNGNFHGGWVLITRETFISGCLFCRTENG
ncbi:uncharacterized protein LOC124702446 isoform X2 [Lolium rigidum]|uniref:uncharacterized protein LOC124702446 isoform X2 n=1 Tax=Lolium rigidum TaxID=89674 RepID=UPI001F5CD2B0|nr:uncharacterized protein LOC124702446 isoform X2 [Lolium rigidum]